MPPGVCAAQLPYNGGSGEQSLLRCHGLWTGFCNVTVEDYAQLEAKLLEVIEPGVVSVSGIPPDAPREALAAVFEKFGMESLQYVSGAATALVVLRDKRSVESVRMVVDATNRAVLGHARITVELVKRLSAK